MNLSLNMSPPPSDPMLNLVPTIPSDSRVAIVTDYPSSQDFEAGKPMSANVYSVLKACLTKQNLSPLRTLFGYIYSYMPPAGRMASADYALLTESKLRLRKDLDTFRPNVILLLGDYALSLAGIPHSVNDYRGSLFICQEPTSPFFGYKCLATYEPSLVIRRWEYFPLFDLDIRRASNESRTPALTKTPRRLTIDLSTSEIISRLEAIPNGSVISVDIEGYVDRVTCCSIGLSPEDVFIIPFSSVSLSEEVLLWKAFSRVMGNWEIKKVMQNGLYDQFVLAWSYKVLIRGYEYDTMLGGWEVFPELPKSLAVQTSVWTNEPYYKSEGKVQDLSVHHLYCCKDSAVTHEINQRHQEFFQKAEYAGSHYRFNMRLLPLIMYMQLKGIRYDQVGAKEVLDRTNALMYDIQQRLNAARKVAIGDVGAVINLNSPTQLTKFLYNELLLPAQYKKEGGRKTNKKTTDVQALLELSKLYNHPAVKDILKFRKLEKIRQMLEVKTEADGRVHCSYNPVGTETGRLSCSKSATGNGTNLQTVTKELRRFYVPDEGYEFFQLDLSGADGWTVAAHCKRLGDPTMMDDYLFGLKPAKIISCMYLHGPSVGRLSRPELADLCKTLPDNWVYAAAKAVQHGTSYGMGTSTMSNNILLQSYKKSGTPTYVSPADCKKLQALFSQRYPGIVAWHNWVAQQLRVSRALGSASGHIRTFFGRATDPATHRAALAQEPQANTTYATNLAMLRLWEDPENRREDGTLIIEPLHQVHDAACGQWRIEDREFAIRKLKTYFDNELEIAGIKLVIPFEGTYGTSWYDESNKI